jgi:hypothetical protein
MTMFVVDALEMVDIDDRDREPGVVASGADADVIGEVPAVEEPGQIVDPREPLEPPDGVRALRFRDPLGGHVARGAVQQHASTGDPHAGAIADPADDAVVPEQAVVLLDDLAVRLQQVGVRPGVPEAGEILVVHATGGGRAAVVRIGAQQLGVARTLGVHHEGPIGQNLGAVQELADHLRRTREGESRELGVLSRVLQLRVQQLALRHVLDDHDARIELRRDADRDDRGEALAVLAEERHVELALASVGGRRADGADVRVVLGWPVGKRRPCVHELVTGEPGHLAHGLVDCGDLTVRAQHHDPVADRGQHGFGDQPLGPGARRRRAEISARKRQ